MFELRTIKNGTLINASYSSIEEVWPLFLEASKYEKTSLWKDGKKLNSFHMAQETGKSENVIQTFLNISTSAWRLEKFLLKK